MDADTLVRHRLPVGDDLRGITRAGAGNRHPMRAIYGYDVAADLQLGAATTR